MKHTEQNNSIIRVYTDRLGDTRWHSWLRHCATSHKADSRWCHWNFSLT